MTDQELFNYHTAKFNALDPLLRSRMVTVVKEKLDPDDVEKIRLSIRDNPLTWWAPYHFFFGMGIRNLLRKAGLGEQEYPFLENLDDYWVRVVEDAVSETTS